MPLHALLRLAYSAERAAAFAYRGHAASVRNKDEQKHIAVIEAEEWEHRAHMLRMMKRVQVAPSVYLEIKYYLIGTFISWACHVLGYFMPMYFAGRLESGNVNEYVKMAELAQGTALADEIPCMLEMARVEKEHELYFLERIIAHKWLPFFTSLFGWGDGKSFNHMKLSTKDDSDVEVQDTITSEVVAERVTVNNVS